MDCSLGGAYQGSVDRIDHQTHRLGKGADGLPTGAPF